MNEHFSSDGSFQHSPDYRSVRLEGHTYAATRSQAAVVAVLHRAWLDGVPDVGDEYLRKVADTTSDRLRDVFRAGDLWGNVIVAGSTRGTRRLAICAHEIPT
jgi:hypothetical protein